MELSDLEKTNQELREENENLLNIIKEFTSKMDNINSILKNSKSGKIDLSLIKKCLEDIQENKNKIENSNKVSIYDENTSENNSENSNESLKMKNSVSRSFHSKECNCFSCSVADLSNQLYYNCTDYVKEEISEKNFKEKTIKAINECEFVKNIISKNKYHLLTIYKSRNQLLKKKYNDLLKKLKI